MSEERQVPDLCVDCEQVEDHANHQAVFGSHGFESSIDWEIRGRLAEAQVEAVTEENVRLNALKPMRQWERVIELEEENTNLKCVLRELLDTVRGECPSLLHEDQSDIEFRCDEALKEKP